MASYRLLSERPKYLDPDEGIYTDQRQPRRRWTLLLIGFILVSNAVSLSWPFWMPQKRPPTQLARTIELDTRYERFWWNTAYSPLNRTDADNIWEEINPAHGIVSVDRSWAAAQNWPLSTYHPDDKSKAVYLLEAYHLLHCLRIIRLTLWQAVDGKPFTHRSEGHIDHCFDALRQNVQCNADNTPLYSFGDNTAGDGQLHQCKDWNQLRAWAFENSACYRDSNVGIPFKDHFGFCRGNDDDGLKAIDHGAVTT